MRFELHEGQAAAFQALQDGISTVVVACGRRWGKSELAGLWIMSEAKRDDSEGTASHKAPNWIVAPTYGKLKGLWTKVLELDREFGWITAKHGSRDRPGSVEIGDSLIEFRSGERAGELVGEGLRRVVVDEAATLLEDRWTEDLQPTRIDCDAQALLISVPKGRNWFWREWQIGEQQAAASENSNNLDNTRTHFSYRGSSYENPFIPREAIEKIASELPLSKRRQEIYAEFLEGEGSVFRNIDAITVAYSDQHTVAMGVDLARKHDYTVIIGLDRDGGVTHFERFQGVDWAAQKARILRAMRNHDWPYTLMDETGAGFHITEEMRSAHRAKVRGFTFTNTTKARLIDDLAIAIDERALAIPDEPIIKGELEAYSFEETAAGNIRYNAPQGMHDDCVIALALANKALATKASSPDSVTALINL